MKTLKVVFWIALFVFIIYTGYMFAMPQYKYYAYRSDAADIIRFPVVKEAEMQAELLKRGKELGLPITNESIQVMKSEKRTYAAIISWSETVDILGKYQKTFYFKVEVGDLAGARGGFEGEEGTGRGRKLFL